VCSPAWHRLQNMFSKVGRVLKKEGLLVLGEGVVDPDCPLRNTEIGWCRKAGFELTGSYGSILFYVLRFKLARENCATHSCTSQKDRQQP